MSLPPLSKMDGEILDGMWYVHLRHAACEADIVASVREFLDSLSVHEMGRLPIRCLEVTTSDDIPPLSLFLARAYETLEVESADRPIFMRTIALLCYASDRLTQVPHDAQQAWEASL